MTDRTPASGEDANDGDASNEMDANERDANGEDAHTVRLAVEPNSEGVRDAVSERVREAVADPTFRRYLRRVREGPVAAGDEWAEFVSAGCGSQTPVSLRVVAVEGGARVGRETTFEWE